MNYTTFVDTLSITFPIESLREHYNADAARLFLQAIGSPILEHQVNRSHARDLVRGEFEDWASAAAVLPHDFWACILSDWLHKISGTRFTVKPNMGTKKNYYDNSAYFEGGFVAWGGNNVVYDKTGLPQKRPETVQVYFNADGCKALYAAGNMHALADYVVKTGGSISRVDIALDLLNGEITIDDVHHAYIHEQFKVTRQPKGVRIGQLDARTAGDTVYIGTRGTGKYFRAYEKGKQLGDHNSAWVRLELEITKQNRDISPEILKDTNGGFAQAYPFLADVIQDFTFEGADEQELLVVLHDRKTETQTEHLIRWAQIGYGKLINQMTAALLAQGLTLESASVSIVQALRREGDLARLPQGLLLPNSIYRAAA